MRLKSAVTLLLIAFVTAPPVSVSGQEEPLPAVVPRTSSFTLAELPLAELPLVSLAVEPIHDFRQPTLLDAARANDYVTFDALYREAKARGQSLGAYDTLHELWTYAVTDPIGAFYGVEFYERLARVYPGYTRFIDDYRIVDDRGLVFYPTSETRTFLLDRAVEGNAPRVLLADATPSRTPAVASTSQATRRSRPTSSTSAPAETSARQNRRSSPAAEGSTAATASRTPANRERSASSPSRVPRSTPATTGTAAAVATASPATRAPVAASTPVATTQVAATTPPATEGPAPVIDTPAVVDRSAPVPAVTQPAVTQPSVAEAAPAPAPAVDRATGLATRGILLLVFGVIGIGLLALMLRASDDKKPISLIPEKPVTPFDPVKRPAAPGPQAAPGPAKSEKNRATGSRG